MWKTCSRCGKIHDSKYRCTVGKVYQGGEERKQRSTYVWTQKSKDIRDQANFLCEVCRDQGIFTPTKIEVHHIEKLTESPELLLDDDNLICLCVEHHKQADSNELDKNYLRKLVRQRQRKN